ncbi:MAG: NifB/NifX family molybdenum-iron cluster-binding protein [Methanomassiliicoccales archaeon]|jgi:predicted Fe-Mo cluster-binding NifX family protein|nr:NifB/NifX family molybdenum-iron cluster-binding protein [Methanomassiliicoccales archaeon]
MRICVTATGSNLESDVDPRFGRCEYFIVVDPATLEFKAEQNTGISASGGAGVQAAQKVSQLGVDAVITGSVGPNAFQVLQAAGIKVYTGASGKVRDAVKKFIENKLQTASGPTSAAHAGMRAGRR